MSSGRVAVWKVAPPSEDAAMSPAPPSAATGAAGSEDGACVSAPATVQSDADEHAVSPTTEAGSPLASSCEKVPPPSVVMSSWVVPAGRPAAVTQSDGAPHETAPIAPVLAGRADT